MATPGILTVLAFIAVTTAQIPIPKREVGFVYNGGLAIAPIHFDFYIDQLCPFSKEAWPTILKLADSYGALKFKLTTHLFPLPYHRNSFYASKGSHIVDKVTSGNLTYQWIQAVFDNRDSLVRNATMAMSDYQIIQKYADIAATKFGLSSSMFTSMILADDIELPTRLGWKYCCTRGVAHTPTFMVNDVVVNGDPTWTVADWRMVIDPLLSKVPRVQKTKTSYSACSEGLKQCEYLPKKFECCKPGEFCIPNVGCRC